MSKIENFYNKNPLWNNNEIQFARFVSAISATEDWDILELGEIMNLEQSDLEELIDRANDTWEVAKGNQELSNVIAFPTPETKGVWIAYHVDFSAIYIFETEIEALREAANYAMKVKFVKYGQRL